jgi:hypothetical protein
VLGAGRFKLYLLPVIECCSPDVVLLVTDNRKFICTDELDIDFEELPVKTYNYVETDANSNIIEALNDIDPNVEVKSRTVKRIAENAWSRYQPIQYQPTNPQPFTPGRIY